MDDRDQTHIRPSDSSARTTRSRSKPQPSAGQVAPDQSAIFSAPTMDLPAPQAGNAQPAQTSAAQGEQTQIVAPARTRTSRHVSKPPAQPPQPILFSGRESEVLPEEQITQPAPRPRRQPLGRTRRWLRSRTGRVVIPLLTLLLGLAIGLTAVIWYGLSGEGSLVAVVPAAQGNLIVDANKDFVSQLVRDNLNSAGLPGKVQNVKVTLKHGALIVIEGDDVYPVLFTSITKHFTIDVQPYVRSCVLQVRITHADLSGIPVTTFVQNFQSKINQQLAQKPAGLPGGFTYCTVGVTTEPGGMYITYQAVPVSK